MIRALHVVLGLDIGGLEMFVLDLSRSYAGDVCSIIVCLRGADQSLAQSVGPKVINLNGPDTFSLGTVRDLASIIRRERIDIVHTHNPGPHLYGALAGRLTGRPVIHTKHGRNYPTRPRKVWLNRVATFLTHRVIAVSRDAAKVCLDIEGVPEKKVRTILNGIDAERFSPRKASGTLRTGLGIGRDIPVVGIVARLSKIKNHPLLFQTVVELNSRGLSIALCVVGDGPQRLNLEEAVKSLGIEDNVHFLGACTTVELIYPELDVFVLTSISEGISLTLLEAMACELPIVATSVGGNPEVVEDGVTGALVDEDAVQVADALEALLFGSASSELRRSQGCEGRARVKRLFSMDKTAEAYLDEYRGLLGRS